MGGTWWNFMETGPVLLPCYIWHMELEQVGRLVGEMDFLRLGESLQSPKCKGKQTGSILRACHM